MIRKSIFMVAGVLALSTGSLALGQSPDGYTSGHTALEVFDEAGMEAMPLWVKIWLGVMLATFAAGLLFVWKQPIARWAVGGFVLPFIIAGPIYGALGLPFLSGAIALNHLIFWTPALVLLLLRRPFLDEDQSGAFRIWSGLMTFVIIFSFIFDVRDAVIYLGHILS